jgi:hypothetical protein
VRRQNKFAGYNSKRDKHKQPERASYSDKRAESVNVSEIFVSPPQNLLFNLHRAELWSSPFQRQARKITSLLLLLLLLLSTELYGFCESARANERVK